jgi:AbrB family looped-hinge helix DNA binding protein
VAEEPEIATVGTKGQVVIPLTIRKELGITENKAGNIQ